MRTVFNDSIIRYIDDKDKVSDSIIDYIIHSNDITLKMSLLSRVSLSKNQLRKIILLEKDFNILSILFNSYSEEKFKNLFLLSRNKYILSLAYFRYNLSQNEVKKVENYLGKSFLKSTQYLVPKFVDKLSYSSLRFALEKFSSVTLYHYKEQLKSETLKPSFRDILKKRINSYNGGLLDSSYLKLILDQELNFTLEFIISISLERNFEKFFYDIIDILEPISFRNFITRLKKVEFSKIFPNKEISNENIEEILHKYPLSIINFFSSYNNYKLKNIVFLNCFNYIYSSREFDIYQYINFFLNPNYVEDYNDFIKSLISIKNKRLHKSILSNKNTTLSHAMNLDAELVFSSYHNVDELIDYVFNTLHPKEINTLIVLLNNFDGNLEQLIGCIKNLRN